MPWDRRIVGLGLMFTLALTVGCQSRLNVEAAYHLEAGVLKETEIDPPRYERPVAFTIRSDEPINVYVYLKKDQDAALDAIPRRQKSEIILGSQEGVRSDTLEVTLPANEPAIVALESLGKAANVTMSIKGR